MVDIQLKTVSRDRCQSFWHVSAESTQGCQTFPIHERGEDAVQCIHQQQTRLLQQLLCRCHYRGLVIIPQSVQNTAARFISKSGKFDHLTPILRNLLWLPVRRRVDFKVHGDTRPQVSARSHATASLRWLYINTSISSLSGRQHIRSADTRELFVQKTFTNRGSRFIAVFGTNLWNSLPTKLRTIEIVYHRNVKTHTCSVCYCCYANLQFRTNLRDTNILIIIIIIIIRIIRIIIIPSCRIISYFQCLRALCHCWAKTNPLINK